MVSTALLTCLSFLFSVCIALHGRRRQGEQRRPPVHQGPAGRARQVHHHGEPPSLPFAVYFAAIIVLKRGGEIECSETSPVNFCAHLPRTATTLSPSSTSTSTHHHSIALQVNTQFGGNQLFQKALKDAFNDLVNRDVGKFKTADLVASFCDRCVCVIKGVGC